MYGNYVPLDQRNPDVFAYIRELPCEKVLVLLSFSDKGGSFKSPAEFTLGEEWINNYPFPIKNTDGRIALKPWQAAVIKLE